jgi:hypothetical protein
MIHILNNCKRTLTVERQWLYLLFALLLPLLVSADSDRFTASVTDNNLAVGDQFQVTFTVNGSGNVRNFKAPSFQDFNVLMGPSQSSNMQIINGSVTQSYSFTYVLQAVKEGNFKIPGAEVLVGNDRLISNTVNVTVVKGNRPQGGQGGGQDNTSLSSNVFLKASVDKSSAYRGEAIVVTYKLYTRVDLLNYSLEKLPNLTGFWSQEIPLPQRPEFHQENLDGVTYRVGEIKKLVLFPQRSGALEVDAMKGEVIARVQVKRQRNNDPFNQFFNDPFFNNPFFNNSVQDVKVPLKSAAVRINVKELPSGEPSGFSGAVGKFSCEISLDKEKVKTNEAVTLRMKISGKGNLKLVDAPKVDFPPDMETYEPKENVNASATAAGVTGSKTFEYLIIPRTAGEYKLSVQPFTYFDLDKKQYVEIPSPELLLQVEKGNETVTTTVTTANKSDIQLIGKDILYIKTGNPDWRSTAERCFGSTLFRFLFLLPAGLFVVAAFLLKRYREKLSNVTLLKSERASKTALKRLSTAKGFMDLKERDKFLDELFRALWGFVSDKLGIPVADLSKQTASEALERKGVPKELIDDFIRSTDACEFARFAGSSGSDEQTLYKQGLSVITRLENTIRS